MESVVGDDPVRRFFKSVDPVLRAEWIARLAKPRWGALPDKPLPENPVSEQRQ